MRRRQWLTVSGMVVASLAGCTDGKNADGGGGGDDTTSRGGDGTTASDADRQTGTVETGTPETGTDAPASGTTEDTETVEETEPAGETETTGTAEGTDAGTGDLGDPAATVEAMIGALDDADRDRLVDLAHSNGPLEVTDETLDTGESADITVQETELLTERIGIAEVRTVLLFEYDDGETERRELVYELRPEEGEWHVWVAKARSDYDEDGRKWSPNVAWSFTDLAEEDVVEIGNDEGDVVQVANVTVRIDGEASGTMADYTAAEVLSVGDTVTVDVPSDSTGELQLVWSNPNTDGPRELATHDYDVR